MEPSLDKAKAVIRDFSGACISCGVCKDVCPFLVKYGTPDEILSNKSEDVFKCTNCKACDSSCSVGLSPSEALHSLKYQLVREGVLSEKAKGNLQSAYGFAMRGHKFPFSYYPKTETVFWPGCSLSGSTPEVVKKTVKLLSEHLNTKVGLCLDCCFDPCFQNGDVDTVKKSFEVIRQRFEAHNIKNIYVGCTNCYKVFSLFLPDMNVRHVFEALPEKKLSTDAYLHHPCPAWRFDKLRDTLKDKLGPIKEEAIQPMCCGLGGGSSRLDSDLSERFRERVVSASKESDIVTYCNGCKNYFLQKGKKVYHALEILTDVKPFEQPVSSAKRWLNRLILAFSQRINIKKIAIALLVVSLIVLTTVLRKEGYISAESLFALIAEHKFLAPALFIFIYAIGPSLFLPSLPLTLGAGFLWGPVWGVVFSITGATLGSSVSFLIARYILGDTIKERFSYARWQMLKEKVEKHGWKAVAFTRIVPIFPYPVLNYLFGVTPIPFLHYLWATFVFMLPACIAYTAFVSVRQNSVATASIQL
ncbi:MAG: VTT domain-containing protein, partial [Thermodesulfovibrionales bacterium]